MRILHAGLRPLVTGYVVLGSIAATAAVLVLGLWPVVVMVFRREIATEFLTRPFALAALFLPLLYGVFRSLMFHPLFDVRYREWLGRSPWTPAHPLPKGPVNVVWPDVAVIGMLSFIEYLLALSITGPDWPYVVAPVLLFSGALVVIWSCANALTGQTWYVHGVLWTPVVFTLTVAIGLPPITMLLCPLVMAVIAWLGVRRGLANFPWTDRTNESSTKSTGACVGWPFATLLESGAEFPVAIRKALAEAALVAAWVWFLLIPVVAKNPREDLGVIFFTFMIAAVFAAGWRLSRYSPAICDGQCWGRRIANRQWIIPRHDQIFLAPLLMIAGASVLPWLLFSVLGASASWSFAPAAGLIVLVGRAMGPRVQELQYTGVHSKFGRLGQSKEFRTIGAAKS